MATRESILEDEYEKIIADANGELEVKASEIRGVEFSADQSPAEWTKNKNLIQAIIRKSEEIWARKKVASERLEMINQSSLDEFETEEEEEEEEEEELDWETDRKSVV